MRVRQPSRAASRGAVRVGYVILLLLAVSIAFIVKGRERGLGGAPPAPATQAAAPVAEAPKAALANVPAIESTGGADAMLTRAASGHFYASGRINGFPVVYIVDTGATLVTLTPDQAHNAGVTQCAPMRVRTASGFNEGCVARVPEICFAQFCVRDAEVYISNGMVGEALLGMNVLRNFRITQQGDTMRIGL